jgi:hypothetical protein
MLIFIFVGIIVAVLVALLFVIGLRASKLMEEMEPLEQRCKVLQSENGQLRAQISELDAEDKKKVGWLDGMEEELAWLRAELEKRPKLERKVYRILTIGIKATGKTSLTLKWSNPLTDLGTIEGTKIERYERSVSHVREKDKLVEHVFEVHDWGGEHIVDALQELMVEEVHGLLIVVDLGDQEAKTIDLERIAMQLDEFKPQSLRYFFSPKTVASCKSVVLFINKSDLIAGTPAQVEKQAKDLYQTLIDGIQRYANQIDVKVFVGSASSGHSTHMLFSHFVERILPKNAYDQQLLQRMKAEWRKRPPTPSAQLAQWVQAGPSVPAGRGTLPTSLPMGAVLSEKPAVEPDPHEFGNTAPMLGFGAKGAEGDPKPQMFNPARQWVPQGRG